MFTHLHILNFAIVDQLELELQPNTTVITGETGAGKSIMIDALQLCLGARADSKQIRAGSDKCEITACFDVSAQPHIQAWLREHDLSADDECVLRRVINKDGRSRCYINGCPSPQQLVKELAPFLVGIHGQHENQVLMKRDNQRAIVDAFAGNQKLLTSIADLYKQSQQAKQELQQLMSASDNQSRFELLSYQVSELNELGLADGEVKQLELEHKQLANAEDIIYSCQQAMAFIQEHDASAESAVNSAMAQIQDAQNIDASVKEAYDMLASASVQIGEASSELRNYLDRVQPDPERLQAVEARLQLIYDIARKHRIKPGELGEFVATLSAELKALEGSEERITELHQLIKQYEKDYALIAKKLTASRKKAATKLQQQVTQSIHQLGMPSGEFAIQLLAHEGLEIHLHGHERIEFMVSANPGQPLRPMSKVASGGELSRISLAIQVINTQSEQTPTMFFDEVDVGIGGGTAEIVGKLLRKLGENAQIFCVTHQAQVAAQGHQHFQVSKQTDGKSTHTSVGSLTGKERTQEIARMIGGVEITKQTLAHAEEMLQG